VKQSGTWKLFRDLFLSHLFKELLSCTYAHGARKFLFVYLFIFIFYYLLLPPRHQRNDRHLFLCNKKVYLRGERDSAIAALKQVIQASTKKDG
jgi:hypothetical protein